MSEDRVQSTRATYDLIAVDYTARNSNAADRDWLPELTASLPPGARVVDLGCGPGTDAVLLRAEGFDVVGLDLSTSMLTIARQAGVPVLQGDLRRLPLRDRSVDAVCSSASLLHVPREQTVATLVEWRRVTRDGGVLRLATSNGDDEGWEVVPYAPPPEGEPDRRRWFVHRTREELVDALHDAGWRVEHVGARESHRRWHLVRARA
ncbi:MAG TPA: class I SAM-dependent methyltransferase [Mycobacteriales bacterium]|nr:class I SAM-dependent methyltransferase [Mycobacteriales bacterium]